MSLSLSFAKLLTSSLSSPFSCSSFFLFLFFFFLFFFLLLLLPFLLPLFISCLLFISFFALFCLIHFHYAKRKWNLGPKWKKRPWWWRTRGQLDIGLLDTWRTTMNNCTMVQNRKKHSKSSHLIIHYPTSSGVNEWASELTSERSEQCEVISVVQANEWAVRANEQTDKRVAQYLHLDFWLF